MNRRIPIPGFLVLVAAIILNSCALFGGDSYPKFRMYCPYESLSATEIASIGADGFTGTPEEIAGRIKDWQTANMVLTDPSSQDDVSYPMRWNYIMPGFFPVSEMIGTRTLMEGGVRKIYGVCWDYAAIFSAIAKFYGLSTRITAYRSYMSDRPEYAAWNQGPGQDRGMSPEEFSVFDLRQKGKGLRFPQELVAREARETWEHYRAEVRIGDVWKAFDATEPTGEWADDSNYTVEVPWDEGASAALCE